MKKNRFLIFIAVLLLIIIVILLLLRKTSKEEENVDEFSFGEVFEEIDLASNQSFIEISNTNITQYLPLDFSSYNNLLFAIDVDNKEEYFIIGKNLERSQQSQLEKIYSSSNEEDNIIFYSDDKYIYLIKSEEYSYIIDGIIKSFIVNYENKE